MTIKVNSDFSQAEAALGFIDGMTTTINTSRYIGSVTKYAHAAMAQAFDTDLGIVARGNPDNFNHVYEARSLGMPTGQLWKHRLEGGGRYTSIASFVFLPSMQPILTPEERQKNSNDPMSQVDSSVIAKLSGRSYTFTNKATVMEYGLLAVVKPVNVKKLFVPVLWNQSHYVLKGSTVQNWRRADPQDSGGGVGTQGKFTMFWTDWWSIEAPRIWDSKVRLTIEGDLGKCEHEMIKATRGRMKPKAFKMNVFSAKADYDAGQLMAQSIINNQAMSYESASHYIDRALIK